MSITITRPEMPAITLAPPDRYGLALSALAKTVLDAELAGQREASVAYLSLRSVLMSVRAAEDPMVLMAELVPWSFAEADRLVDVARIEHNGADTSSAEILRNAAEVMRCNLRTTGEFYDKAVALAKGVAPSNCPVDVLGAIALSCGLAPDVWDRWKGEQPVGYRAVAAVAAAWTLVHHLEITVGEHSLDFLVRELAAWHDGVCFDEVLSALGECADRLYGGLTRG